MTSSEIAREILVALRRIIHGIDLHSRFLARKYHLTGPQLVVLNEIVAAGEISGSQIADRVSLSHGTVVGITNRLEQRNYIARRRSESDRRRVWFFATPEGAGLLESAPPLLRDAFVDQLGALEFWEQTQILASLDRIAGMMEAEVSEVGVPLVGADAADTANAAD